MVNIAKIKSLAKSKGIKQGYICEQLGIGITYLNDVAKGKNTMSEERIFTVARILGTSFEYLTDLTDDPDPNFLARSAQSMEEKLIQLFMQRVFALQPEQLQIIEKLLEQSDEEFSRSLDVIKAMSR